MSWLIVSSLQAGYGSRPVLLDASVELNKGEIALVVGPNGAGKSTLLRAIYRQCDINGAKAFSYRDNDIRKTPLRRLMQLGLAYTPQYRNVFDRLTVRENLTLAIAMRDGQRALERFESVIGNISELVPMLGKSAGQLSGGQRQVLALAMGLAVPPELLLLDEPLASLDEHSIARVSAIIQLYRKIHNVAFVIVEHRFMKLTAIADRCYGMKLGKTVVALDAAQLRDSSQFESAMQDIFFT